MEPQTLPPTAEINQGSVVKKPNAPRPPLTRRQVAGPASLPAFHAISMEALNFVYSQRKRDDALVEIVRIIE